MRQRPAFWRTPWLALACGLLLGLLAGLGEFVDLTWFRQGTGFRPVVLVYALIIDGGLGLVLGAVAGVVWAVLRRFLRRRVPVPDRRTVVVVERRSPASSGNPHLQQPITRRAAIRMGAVAGCLALAGAGSLALAASRRSHAQEALAATYAPAVAPPAKRPNVVLITLDTVRADFLGAYGNPVMHTPTLDRLASQSARFAWNAIQEPQTNPSHGSMFTGVYPSVSGIRVHMVDKLPANLTPLAEVFGSEGYLTAGLYSWLSFDPVYCGFERGFQTYQNLASPAPGILSAPALRQAAAEYRVAEEFLAVPRAVSQLLGYQDQVEEANKGRADVTTDAAIAQLNVMAGQPFFLWVHYFDAHYPYIPPAGFADEYDPNYHGTIDGSVDTVNAIQGGKLNPQGADLARLKSLYQGELTYLDQQLSRLFGALDNLNLSDNTVLALTADHGEAFGEHPEMVEGVPFFHPHSLHNEEIRTPLLLRYPGQIKAGTVVQAPTQAIDIFPTLIELAGLKVPDQNQGDSLVRLLDGSDDGSGRAAFSAMPDYTFSSLVVPGWKYVQNNPGGEIELFNLQNDPGETHDVATAEADVARQLEGKVNDWMKANNVQ